MRTQKAAPRRAMWLRLAIGVITAGLVFATAPAAAAQPASAAAAGCHENPDREFDTPWYNTDVNDVNVCIGEQFGGEYRAVIYGYFTDGGDGSRKFDEFRINVRIEQDGWIHVAANTCSYTREVNAMSSGGFQCVVEDVPVGGGAITADGSITYNINSDGRGDYTWQLHGSPRA